MLASVLFHICDCLVLRKLDLLVLLEQFCGKMLLQVLNSLLLLLGKSLHLNVPHHELLVFANQGLNFVLAFPEHCSQVADDRVCFLELVDFFKLTLTVLLLHQGTL